MSAAGRAKYGEVQQGSFRKKFSHDKHMDILGKQISSPEVLAAALNNHGSGTV